MSIIQVMCRLCICIKNISYYCKLAIFICNAKCLLKSKISCARRNYDYFIITQPGQKEEYFLSNTEERTLLRFYELQLRDFCRRFNPPMPRATVATALHYFKRFYIKNSVMDYHPKEILVTCVYLACKVIILPGISFFMTFVISIFLYEFCDFRLKNLMSLYLNLQQILREIGIKRLI